MPGELGLHGKLYVRGGLAHSTRPRLDVALQLGVEITLLRGPSGAGKSTLLACLAGLLRPDGGALRWGEHEIWSDAERGIWLPPHRRRVAWMVQSLALFPHLKVWENVAYGLPTREAKRERAMHWLERVQALALVERRPDTLSGGEAQRVALARALASEPRVLLLDEPFSALDAVLRKELAAMLHALWLERPLPVLWVSHLPEELEPYAQRVLRIEAGVWAE